MFSKRWPNSHHFGDKITFFLNIINKIVKFFEICIFAASKIIEKGFYENSNQMLNY